MLVLLVSLQDTTMEVAGPVFPHRADLRLDGSANAMCMGGCVLIDVADSWILA